VEAWISFAAYQLSHVTKPHADFTPFRHSLTNGLDNTTQSRKHLVLCQLLRKLDSRFAEVEVFKAAEVSICCKDCGLFSCGLLRQVSTAEVIRELKHWSRTTFTPSARVPSDFAEVAEMQASFLLQASLQILNISIPHLSIVSGTTIRLF